MNVPDTDPVIHSHHTDVLPEDHPKAYVGASCLRCRTLVHASNNECMTTWIEWGEAVLCGECFMPLLADGVLAWAQFEALCTAERRSAEST
jgi:hypothetical protein